MSANRREHRALAPATEQRRVDAPERAVADTVDENEAPELVDIIEAERGDFETRFLAENRQRLKEPTLDLPGAPDPR